MADPKVETLKQKVSSNEGTQALVQSVLQAQKEMDPNQRARSTVANLLRIKRLQEQTAKHRESATTDSLTGLLNRAGFEKRLNEEALRARRLGYDLFLIALDLNGLKTLNDSEGHEAGDQLLKRTGSILKRGTRPTTDFAARSGGDEFSVVLAEKPADDPRLWWRKIKRDFQRQGISISAGLAKIDIRNNGFSMEKISESIESAKIKADQNMYEAKQLVKKTPGETSLMAGGQ